MDPCSLCRFLSSASAKTKTNCAQTCICACIQYGGSRPASTYRAFVRVYNVHRPCIHTHRHIHTPNLFLMRHCGRSDRWAPAYTQMYVFEPLPPDHTHGDSGTPIACRAHAHTSKFEIPPLRPSSAPIAVHAGQLDAEAVQQRACRALGRCRRNDPVTHKCACIVCVFFRSIQSSVRLHEL